MQISRPVEGNLPGVNRRAIDKQAVALRVELQEMRLNPPKRHHGRAAVRAAGILICIEETNP